MNNIKDLERKSKWIRNKVLDMTISANKGHIGGAYSCIDILTALYYGNILKIDPKRPKWDERDRFVLSKGHAGPAIYPILSDLGYFPLSKLDTFCQKDSLLGSHPIKDIPGIDTTTGSLGHGLSIASGIALRGRLDKKDYKVYVLLGDCECHEGSVWEAVLFAGHHKLNNIITIIDHNKQCSTDYTEYIIDLQPLSDKWRAFNWDVEIINGHSFEELLSVFDKNKKRERPLTIIANTIKGKGVSFMEKEIEWHHKVPTGKYIEIARQELN